jgi:hypothetical protein
MAKKLLTSYTFTPGAANAGTLVVSGSYALEQFLLVTNVTTGATIYQFNAPAKGGAVNSSGGNTTLTLEYNTSAMSSSDRLQVFIDDGLNPQFTLTNASVEISNDVGNAVPVSGTVAVSGTVPVSGTVAISNSSVEIANDVGNPVPVSGTVTATGPLTDAQLRATAIAVNAASLPLPSGAATAANQSTANSSLSSIDGKTAALVSGRVPVDGSGVTQPISAASLPLPTGAATSASQTTGNTSLASIDSKLPALSSGSVPVLVQNGQLEIQNDTGNPIPVGPASQLNVTGSASALNADLIAATACDAYRMVTLQITGTWVGTATFQASNDNTNWFSTIAKPSADTSGPFTSTTTLNNLFSLPLFGFQFFRVRFTGYTSGTATATAFFSKDTVSVVPATAGTQPTYIVGTTTGSATNLYTVNSAASANAASIKATGANLYGLSVMNTSAATKYVRLFNLTTAPTVGTSVPIMVVAIPATSSKEIEYVPALRFGTGLAVAITGGAAATDATAVAAGDVQLLVSYA